MNLVQYIESIHREQRIKESSPDLDSIFGNMSRGALEKIASGEVSLEQALEKTTDSDESNANGKNETKSEKTTEEQREESPVAKDDVRPKENVKESRAKFAMFDSIARIMARGTVEKIATDYKIASTMGEMTKIDEFISPESQAKAKIVKNSMKMCKDETEKKASIRAAGMALSMVNRISAAADMEKKSSVGRCVKRQKK